MDEAAIREALAQLTNDAGARLLAPDDVAGVAIEGDWLAVAVTREGTTSELLRRVHAGLRGAFPDAQVEVRADDRTHRGGAGFGEGQHVVAVLGGKGGVGKSTLSVNLALTLAAMGMNVGLLDADLNAPDVPHLLGIHPQRSPRGLGWRLQSTRPTPPSERQRPHERFGVEMMSAGFVVPERFPTQITTRNLVGALLRFLIFDVAWNADVLIIDAPPGTGEELQVLARELPLSGVVFVTTPQDLAQMDAERTLTLLTDHDVPVIGWVQNMASLTCPHCEQQIDMFARSPRLAQAGLEVLGRIPFDVQLSFAADKGRPLVLGDPRGPVAYEFARIAAQVRRWLAARDTA